MQDGFLTENKTSLAGEQSGFASRAFGNAYFLLVLTMFFWAGNAVVGRGAAGLVPPFTLAWLRWTIAFVMILPLAWSALKRDSAIIRTHWVVLALLGGVGAGTFVSLFYFGLSQTTAINGVIINSATSILVPLVVFAVYRETVTPLQAVGIVVSFVGVLIVLTKGDLALLLTLQLNRGDLWVIVATVVWAAYSALLREVPKIHWLSFAAISFGMASLVNLPAFVVEMALGKFIHPTPPALLMIAYVSTLPSIVSQIFYVRAIELIGSSRSAIFMHLVPVFGAVLAILFLGEHLHLYHFGGLMLVIGGVWLASRGPKVRRIDVENAKEP
jgi:drug/metabolite transporter (DMT)-like permease